jgi:hypothetical protein
LAAISGCTLSAPRTPGNVFKMVSRVGEFQDKVNGANAILSADISNRSHAESTILRKERLPRMNVVDGLTTIRERLVAQNANPKTLTYVDVFIKRAQTPGASNAASASLTQLVKMLLRTPGSQDNTVIYNDFARLEESLTNAASDFMARKAAEDAKPVPKTKKYYKDLKDKDLKE